MEQLAARRAHNPKVGGSSPPPATTADNSRELSAFFFLQLTAKVTSLFPFSPVSFGPVVSSLPPTSIGESGSLLVFGRFPGYRCITCGGWYGAFLPSLVVRFAFRNASVRTVLDFQLSFVRNLLIVSRCFGLVLGFFLQCVRPQWLLSAIFAVEFSGGSIIWKE